MEFTIALMAICGVALYYAWLDHRDDDRARPYDHEADGM